MNLMRLIDHRERTVRKNGSVERKLCLVLGFRGGLDTTNPSGVVSGGGERS